jgi:hypothetical protein
MPLT